MREYDTSHIVRECELMLQEKRETEMKGRKDKGRQRERVEGAKRIADGVRDL